VSDALDSDWLQRLHERAAMPPLRPREVLLLQGSGTPIGSLEPALARRLRDAGLLAGTGTGACVVAGGDAALAAIARWLAAEGLASRWRNELLAVTDAESRTVGAIERAAVRPLGITTFAVHLVGCSPDGRYWLQRRALDKATDPGLWDTLMGGLVAAGESTLQTLERETWEEAGLRLAELEAVRLLGRLTVRRPVREGYMVEQIEMFRAVLPEGLVPVNQDGEVMAFACLDAQTLRDRLAADAFTLEAALILAHALSDGASGPTPGPR